MTIDIGTRVKITTGKKEYEGTVMSHTEGCPKPYAVKLDIDRWIQVDEDRIEVVEQMELI